MKLSLLIFSIILSSFCYADIKPFTIIATPMAPYKFKSKYGSTVGITIDVVEKVMKELNVKYKIQLIGSGSRVILQAKTGKADMVLLFSRKKERLEYLIYPKESYMNISWNFFIRKEDEKKIKYDSFDDLRGLRIGATKDFAYTKEFWNSGLKLDIIPDNNLQIGKLLLKRIDAVPMITVQILYRSQLSGNQNKISYLPKILKDKPYYDVFPKASKHPDQEKVIKNYDKIINRMKKDGTIQKIFDKYLKSKKSASL